MARPLAAALLTFAAIALACAGPAEEPVVEEAVVEEPGAALSEPWASLSLPVSNGSVLYSDSTGMMASHTQTFQEVSDAYAGALRGGGYAVATGLAGSAGLAFLVSAVGPFVGPVVRYLRTER